MNLSQTTLTGGFRAYMHQRSKIMRGLFLSRANANKSFAYNFSKFCGLSYYISSRTLTAQEVLAATREHWQVENCLHWVLDVAFDEDRSRARQGFAAENLAPARQIALNLLKQDPMHKVGVKKKRKACCWDLDYMLKVLGEIKI